MSSIKTPNESIILPKSYRGLESFSQDNKIEIIQLTKNDWFFSKVINLKNEKSIFVSYIFLSFFILIVIISGILENVFVNDELKIDLLHDLGLWGIFALDYILIAFSSSIYKNFSKIFLQFHKNNVLQDDNAIYNKFFNQCNRYINNRGLIISMYVIAGITTAIQIFTFVNSAQNVDSSWIFPPFLGKISITHFLTTPMKLLLHLLIVQLFVRLMATCIIMIAFFKQKKINLNIQILHPDKCGGIGEIGKYSIKINSLLFIISLFIVGMFYNNVVLFELPIFSVMNIVATLIFIIGAVVLVFSPIVAAHKRMRTTKDEFLFIVNKNFEDENNRLRNILSSDQKVKSSDIETINSIQEIYKFVDIQPTWPFNYKVIYSFIGSIAPPIIVFILNFVIKMMTSSQ